MSNVSKCFFCANKKDYDAKFGYFGCAYSGQECKDYSMFEPKVKPKPITNADRIRAMTDEELAEFMCHNVSNGTVNCAFCAAAEFCRMGHNGWLDWLKQEASND